MQHQPYITSKEQICCNNVTRQRGESYETGYWEVDGPNVYEKLKTFLSPVHNMCCPVVTDTHYSCTVSAGSPEMHTPFELWCVDKLVPVATRVLTNRVGGSTSGYKNASNTVVFNEITREVLMLSGGNFFHGTFLTPHNHVNFRRLVPVHGLRGTWLVTVEECLEDHTVIPHTYMFNFLENLLIGEVKVGGDAVYKSSISGKTCVYSVRHEGGIKLERGDFTLEEAPGELLFTGLRYSKEPLFKELVYNIEDLNDRRRLFMSFRAEHVKGEGICLEEDPQTGLKSLTSADDMLRLPDDMEDLDPANLPKPGPDFVPPPVPKSRQMVVEKVLSPNVWVARGERSDLKPFADSHAVSRALNAPLSGRTVYDWDALIEGADDDSLKKALKDLSQQYKNPPPDICCAELAKYKVKYVMEAETLLGSDTSSPSAEYDVQFRRDICRGCSEYKTTDGSLRLMADAVCSKTGDSVLGFTLSSAGTCPERQW